MEIVPNDGLSRGERLSQRTARPPALTAQEKRRLKTQQVQGNEILPYPGVDFRASLPPHAKGKLLFCTDTELNA